MVRKSSLLLLVFIVSLLASCAKSGKNKLEPYLEVELKKVEETYNLLYTFGEQIWPGWTEHQKIQFSVQFPNLVFMMINPIEEVPEGYVKLDGRTLRGMDIYLNRTEELPIKLEPPLSGGGKGGTKIRIMLGESRFAEQTAGKPDEMVQQMRRGMASEKQILLDVHEHFHGLQQLIRERIHPPAEKKTPQPERPKRSKPRPMYMPTTDYAVYKEIAGEALLAAYNEADDDIARNCLKDYVVAREKQLTAMPKEFADDERQTQIMEGTATYSNTKMAMLAQDPEYRPVITPEDDPFFFEYQDMDAYIADNMDHRIKFCMKSTLDTLGHSYTYGVYQCFLLDRFLPGWKKGFFEEEKSMDGVMEEMLGLSDQDKKTIAAGFREKYEYDKIYARHNAVITERDEAIAMIESRKGRKYVVDFEPTREFFYAQPRGKNVRIGVRQIFLNGIEHLSLGDVHLTSIDIPMEREWIYTVQWVDTEAKEGEKGYDLTYETKDGDVYKNIAFETKGFTLKAPEVKITEEENDTLRITILSKVARTTEPSGE